MGIPWGCAGRRCIALLLAAAAAAGLDSFETLRLADNRACLFWAPAATEGPVPLVVVLHGYNVESLATLDYYFSDVKRLAVERGLAVAAPLGRRNGARGNDGSLCWDAWGQGRNRDFDISSTCFLGDHTSQ